MNNLPKYKIYETVWFFDPWTSIWPVKGVIHQQPHVLKNGVILYHIFSDKYKILRRKKRNATLRFGRPYCYSGKDFKSL